MPLRFNRTGRLVIKPKSVHIPVKRSVKHVSVEDKTLPKNIKNDKDVPIIKRTAEKQTGISNTMQSLLSVPHASMPSSNNRG